MEPRMLTAAIGAAIIAVSSLAAGSVVAASQSSDEVALQPTRTAARASTEPKVNTLAPEMPLDEKLQQLQLLSDGQVMNPDGTVNEALARAGLGSVFSLVDPAKINQLQHAAVEHSRLHIPILFAYDTIHGYRTVFPIPLGAA